MYIISFHSNSKRFKSIYFENVFWRKIEPRIRFRWFSGRDNFEKGFKRCSFSTINRITYFQWKMDIYFLPELKHQSQGFLWIWAHFYLFNICWQKVTITCSFYILLMWKSCHILLFFNSILNDFFGPISLFR